MEIRNKFMKFAILMSILFLAGILLFGGFSPETSAKSVVNLEVCVMNADGSNLINLTQNPADDTSPVWSPDGKKIAFLSNREGGQRIYVMDADGTNVIRLTGELESVNWLAWSPNGKKIAFVDGDLYVMDSDGSNAHELVMSVSRINGVSWSPDSKKLAFSGKPCMVSPISGGHIYPPKGCYDEDSTENIYVINIDGSGLTQVTNVPTDPVKRRAESPAWSPDGKMIAFDYTGFPSVVDPDGRNLIVLSRNHMLPPVWLNSRKIAAFGDVIHVMDVKSRSEITLGNKIEIDLSCGAWPVWSPDGKKIAFAKDMEIHVLNVEGGKETTLASGSYPTWSSDGKKIAFVRTLITQPSQPPSVGSWTSLAPAPVIGYDIVISWDGGNYIYAYKGRSGVYYRYSISDNLWTSIAASIPDDKALPYHDLIWLGGDNLYAFDIWGSKGEGIWSYSISKNSWSRITSFPGSSGSHIAVGVKISGKSYLYVQDFSHFWRYSISDNLWEDVVTTLPYSSAKVWTGGDFIYGISPGYCPYPYEKECFWRYSISSNLWSVLASPPKWYDHLVWAGGDYIYGLGSAEWKGDPMPDLWRYSILGDSWEPLEPLPERTRYQESSMVATSNGIYVLLGGSPNEFFFSSSPAPIPIPGSGPELKKASVYLYGHKTNVNVGEDIILDLSAVNLITNPNMTVQLILQVPSGMSITSVEFIKGGGGQYTATYSVEPGNTRLIEVCIRANQVGNFFVTGYLCYYFAGNKSTAEYRTVTLPVTVRTAKTSTSITIKEISEFTAVITSSIKSVNFSYGSLAVVVVIAIMLFVFLIKGGRRKRRAY